MDTSGVLKKSGQAKIRLVISQALILRDSGIVGETCGGEQLGKSDVMRVRAFVVAGFRA